MALSEVKVDLSREFRRAGHERPHTIELLPGLKPALFGDQDAGFEQPHGRARGAELLLELADRLFDTRELVGLHERIGEHQEERSVSRHGIEPVVEHFDRLVGPLSLQGEHGGGSHHPIVAGGRLAALIDQLLCGGEILFGQRDLEAGEERLDVVRVEPAGLCDVLLGGGEIAALPVPAGEGQPGLRIAGVRPHQFCEHLVGRAGILELLLQDRRQEDERIGAVRGPLVVGIELLCLQIEADEFAGERGCLLEITGSGP